MITAKLSLIDKNRGDLQKRIEDIAKATKGPTKVKVGFPAGMADGSVIAYAVYNHFGTSRGTPPRPFITVALFKGRGKIREALRKMARSIIDGRYDLRTGLERLGLLGVQMIQDQIGSNMPPPNAPSTVRQKGSSRTLIDTGRMRQSVTHKVE